MYEIVVGKNETVRNLRVPVERRQPENKKLT